MVWKRVVAPHLRSVAPCGVGVRIQDAPAAYYEFVHGLTNDAVSAEPARFEFRVRVKQHVGSRSRSLRVRGADADEAGRRALDITGSGWIILEIERR